MDKEKEIQEMANIFCGVTDNEEYDCLECGYYEERAFEENCPRYSDGKRLLEALNYADYRKADEVRKETAKEILDRYKDLANEEEICTQMLDLLNDDIGYDYGVEVDE